MRILFFTIFPYIVPLSMSDVDECAGWSVISHMTRRHEPIETEISVVSEVCPRGSMCINTHGGWRCQGATAGRSREMEGWEGREGGVSREIEG